MNKKKNLNIDDIQLRKKKLQAEIELIEEKYSRKANKISDGIESTLKPIQSIRDNPFKSVGISIAVGFIIGVSGRRKHRSEAVSTDAGKSIASANSGFTTLLMSELKRMAARRAMIYISDFVDRKVMPGLQSTHTDTSKHVSPVDVKSDSE